MEIGAIADPSPDDGSSSLAAVVAAQLSAYTEEPPDLQQFLGNCTHGNLTPCEQWMEQLEQRPFVPSPQVQLLWTILFSTSVSLAVFGNMAVISVVCRRRQLRTKVNLLLLNLSIADLLIATLNAMFNFVFMLKSQWPFGHFYCKVNNFVANLAVAAAVFTITATTLDRYKLTHFHFNFRHFLRTFAQVVWSATSGFVANDRFRPMFTLISIYFAFDETHTLTYIE